MAIVETHHADKALDDSAGLCTKSGVDGSREFGLMGYSGESEKG
jgi:hypothetical protein